MGASFHNWISHLNESTTVGPKEECVRLVGVGGDSSDLERFIRSASTVANASIRLVYSVKKMLTAPDH